MASKILNFRSTLWLVAGLVAFNSCQKKDRLSTSPAALSVYPAATSLLKGGQVTLVARRVAPNGTIETFASDWAISGTCVSGTDLNTSFGETVVFTAPSASNNLCDATITATYGGEVATSHVAIVTYKPASTNLNIYNDQGIPTGADLDVGPVSTSLTITEPATGYAPEGNKYLHFVPSAGGSFWYILLPSVTDLSGYATGKIKFSIYLESAGGSWQVKVKDTADRVVTLGPSNGFDNLTVGSWQEVSIDVADFVTAGLNTAGVTIPFLISESGASNYNVDAVRWEP